MLGSNSKSLGNRVANIHTLQCIHAVCEWSTHFHGDECNIRQAASEH